MSPVDQENTAQQVASRYLLGTVSRLAAFTMDMFARLSILEGAAGVTPGTWLRRSAAGFGDALEHFGPNLAPEWTTTTNQKVYDKAIAAASRVLSSNSSLDPADLVQDMVVNSTRSSGPERTRIFYTVGKKLGSFKNNLGDGTIQPRDSKILGTLERWIRQAAITELKSKHHQVVQPLGEYRQNQTPGAGTLDEDKRQLLMLLALQSPGGPGAEVRRVIDRLIDQHWPRKRERAVVKGFLQKISQPKYRSPAQMRQMVKKFNPARWFTQTVNLVRGELKSEMRVSSQYLTNVLGSKGRNIFKFLREKVGKNSSVKKIIDDLAEEIELLEPGASRVGTERRYELTEDQMPLDPHEAMIEWLRQMQNRRDDGDGDGEKEGGRHPNPDLLHDIFEPGEDMDWDAVTGPFQQYNRGPVELRVAQRFLFAGEEEEGGEDPSEEARENLSWEERLKMLVKQGDERNKRMLYELTKAAFVHAELREDLAPLVRLGHSARVASRDLDLRGLVIRTAYVSTNLKLKRALLDAVVSSDQGHAKTAERGGSGNYRGAFMRWIAGRKFRNPDTDNDNVFVSLPDAERARIYKEWQQGRLDWAQRHRPQGLGPETRITPQNLSQVRVGDVIWRSDSPVKLHRVTKVDKEGWRANAPTFTMVQFDRDNPDQTGEERHLPAAAVRNEMLEYHTVPNMGARADREQARAGLPQKPRGGWPKFQDVGLSDSKREKIQEAFKGMKDVRDPAEVSLKRIQVRLNDALGAHAPRKAVKEFMHELRDWAKQLTQAAAQGGPALRPQAKLWRAMQLKLDQGVSRLDDHDRRVRNTRGESKRRMTPDMDWMTDFMKAKFDAGARGTMKPIYARALLEMSVGASQMNAEGAKNLVKEFKDAGVDMEGTRATIAVGALSGFARHIGEREGMSPSEKRNLARGQADAGRQAKRMMRERRERDREQEQETQRRQEGPRRHQDRAQLRGGGRKQMSAKAKLPSYFIAKVLPVGASDEAKATAKAQLKKATYADLETLRAAAAWIDNNWDDERARTHPLVEHLGYDREGLKKLKKLLKRKLGDVNGRQYHDDVKNMANKYDLESEDADALYDFRIDKPARGRALSDQEKMSKFLAKAKPETRERMQGMSLADFMVMYKAILKEVLEDEEEVAEAA